MLDNIYAATLDIELPYRFEWLLVYALRVAGLDSQPLLMGDHVRDPSSFLMPR